MRLKASLAQFGAVLDRHAHIPGGEARLFIAVIRQAYNDIEIQHYPSKQTTICNEAVRFFFDGRLDLFAHHIGIDPDFVREMLCRSAPGIERFAAS